MFMGSTAMRTTILVAILLALTTSCACVKQAPAPHNPSDPAPYAGKGVSVTFYLDLKASYPRYDVLMRFTNHTDYTHLVQELEIGGDGGPWLVECFRCGKGRSVYDRHRGNGYRRMRVYPANVVGATEVNGFAHLTANQSGGIVTRVSKGFNADYQAVAGYGPWPGRIDRQAPELGSTWRLTPDDETQTVEVWAPSSIAILRG